MEPPRDTALAVDDFGTTAAEQRDGEPVDVRIAREEPDVLAAVDQAGRRVARRRHARSTSAPARASAGSSSPTRARAPTPRRTWSRATSAPTSAATRAEESAMHLEPEV